MKRSGRIARTAWMPRGTKPMKKANRARKNREWARAYGSAERVEWIRSLPSVVSGKGPCVNSHTRTDGIGRKADARWIVPLTLDEEKELHRIGKDSFEAKYRVSLDALAVTIHAAWERIAA